MRSDAYVRAVAVDWVVAIGEAKAMVGRLLVLKRLDLEFDQGFEMGSRVDGT